MISDTFQNVKSLVMPGPRETARLDTGGLRSAFLVDDLFDGELRLVLTDMDRLALGTVTPRDGLRLPPCREFGTRYFTERREMGIVNLGQTGHVRVGAECHSLAPLDFLYIGAGNEDISFEPCKGSTPSFYFLSCPAHSRLPVRKIARHEIQPEILGDPACGSRRRLSKYIHPGLAPSCQLVMGLTELEPGSVWNTLPPHTHSRRSEVYLYFGLEEGVVVHLLGEPRQTRHVVAADRQAVLSPSWSVHCGAGTRPYSFIWGMAGENQSFDDMDALEPSQLR